MTKQKKDDPSSMADLPSLELEQVPDLPQSDLPSPETDDAIMAEMRAAAAASVGELLEVTGTKTDFPPTPALALPQGTPLPASPTTMIGGHYTLNTSKLNDRMVRELFEEHGHSRNKVIDEYEVERLTSLGFPPEAFVQWQ